MHLHGVVRSISFPTLVAVNSDTLGAEGTFEVNQKDYGIKPVSVVGGLVQVKDKVKIRFKFVAIQQR